MRLFWVPLLERRRGGGVVVFLQRQSSLAARRQSMDDGSREPLFITKEDSDGDLKDPFIVAL